VTPVTSLNELIWSTIDWVVVPEAKLSSREPAGPAISTTNWLSDVARSMFPPPNESRKPATCADAVTSTSTSSFPLYSSFAPFTLNVLIWESTDDVT
jgi:hypothetical protein